VADRGDKIDALDKCPTRLLGHDENA
jgi:hypothetical protein